MTLMAFPQDSAVGDANVHALTWSYLHPQCAQILSKLVPMGLSGAGGGRVHPQLQTINPPRQELVSSQLWACPYSHPPPPLQLEPSFSGTVFHSLICSFLYSTIILGAQSCSGREGPVGIRTEKAPV